MDAQGLSLKSQKLGYPVDGDDEKIISGLSTVLVATIQEAKDRISQIEFIFCSQLYPNFQSKFKALHKFYSEARKSLEDQWKQKETELLLQIEEMRLENQRVLEENRLLKDEEAKVKEPLEKELLAKQRKIEELEREIGKKCEEIDEGLELKKNLVELVQSKVSLIAEKERNLKSLEEEVEKLQYALMRKNDKMVEEIKLRETLYANHVELISKIGNAEKERKRLLAEIEELDEEAADYRRKARIKTQEVEHREELRKQLIKQIEVKSSELLENKKKLDVHEKEKQLLLDKVKCLEEKLNWPHKVRNATGESFDIVDLYEKAIRQIESVTSELQAEKSKRIHVTDAYKRLKSQHNYLREKVGLTSENMLHQNNLENESDLSKHKSTITEPGKV